MLVPMNRTREHRTPAEGEGGVRVAQVVEIAQRVDSGVSARASNGRLKLRSQGVRRRRSGRAPDCPLAP